MTANLYRRDGQGWTLVEKDIKGVAMAKVVARRYIRKSEFTEFCIKQGDAYYHLVSKPNMKKQCSRWVTVFEPPIGFDNVD
jgi:hypothetical protein